MAYAISKGLLADIKTTIGIAKESSPDRYEQNKQEGVDQVTFGWFVITTAIPQGGRGAGVQCNLEGKTVTSGTASQLVLHPTYNAGFTDTVIIWDGLFRCGAEGARRWTLALCTLIDNQWHFLHGSGYPNQNYQSTAQGTTTYETGGDPNVTYIGKTTASWAKGTYQNIELYSGTPGAETRLQAIRPGATTLSNVDIRCYNRYVDIDSGKWVRVAGNGELISAEC